MSTNCLPQNVGDVDRMVRILLGSGLIALAAASTWKPHAIALVGAIGGIQILEGFSRY